MTSTAFVGRMRMGGALWGYSKSAFTYRFTVPPDVPGVGELDLGLLAPSAYGSIDLEQTAPDFVYTTLAGTDHLLSEHRGNVVLMDFWGTWCGPCAEAVPALKAMAAKFRT